MIEKYLGSCAKYLEAFQQEHKGCCSSCHDDEEHGYSLFEMETDTGYYQLCCKVFNQIETAPDASGATEVKK